MGLGVLLAFDCYLRVGELCNLTRQDVAGHDDPRLGSAYRGLTALRLGKTKTGNNQWVRVRSPVIRVLLNRLLSLLPSDRNTRVFPFSTATFRSHFKDACSAIGLSGNYVPHSLRHGGATHDSLLQDMSLEDILHHGRWASTKSARHYVQSGRALLLQTSVPPHVILLAQDLVPDVLAAMMALACSYHD